MRKLAEFTVFMAAGLFVFVSCSDQKLVSARYEAEKLLFKAERAMQQMSASGQIAQSDSHKTLLNQFSQALKFSSDALVTFRDRSDSPEYRELGTVAFGAANRLAKLFADNNDYHESAAILDSLVTTIPLSPTQRVNSLLNLGQALLSGGEVDSALEIYDGLINENPVPLDERGELIYPLFDLPLHVYNIAAKAGRKSRETDYGLAEKYYTSLLDRADMGKLYDACHTSLAMLYSDTENWKQAVDHLRLIKDSAGTPHMAAQVMAIDLETSRSENLAATERSVDSLLNHRDKGDTLYYPILLWRKARINYKRGDHLGARRQLNLIKRDYRNFYDRTPGTHLLMAQSFESENKFDRARLEYDILLERFPHSEEAMASYLHLEEYYDKHGREVESRQLREKARKVVQELTGRGRGSLPEARASAFLADIYAYDQHWDSACELLVGLAERFRGTEIACRALNSAAEIYGEKLFDRKRADSLKRAVVENLTLALEPKDLSDQLSK